MGLNTNNINNIAMLVDCDNVSAKYIGSILNHLSKFGVVNIRRAYGNWKSKNLAKWEKILIEYAITPVQQFDYTKGKNATDIAMVIDIMDLLYTKKLSAIALVTSDSDFTPIVIRTLSDGITVYGYGEDKTPASLENACSEFIFVEKLYSTIEDTQTIIKPQLEKQERSLKEDSKLINTLLKAVKMTANEEGWANIAAVGKYISQNSSFSTINYGYQKLGHLMKATNLFDIDMQNANTVMCVRAK